MAEITLDHVAKRFPDGTTAVNDANLDIEDGEFMILVGPSGSGKSTVLNMIAGLEDITEGEIRIGGRLVNQLSPKDRDIAMVFQDYALYPHMTVRDNMAFSLKLAHADRAEVDRKVNQAAELDTTMVYVTHDQVEAMTLGDRVAVMRAGVIQQVGTPEELYRRPRNLFVAGFIGSPSMNFLPATLEDSRLHTPLGDVALPAEVRAKVAEAGAGRELIAGIRPEDFEDAALLDGRRDDGLTFPATVDVLESLGADKYAYFHLAGARATAQELEELAADAGTGDVPGGGDQIVARLDPASRAREGQRLQLWFDPHKLHLFNPDNGAHLTL